MRLWIFAICGLLTIHVAACGDSDPPAVPAPTTTPLAVATEPSEPPAEPTPEPTATSTPESEPDPSDSVSPTPTHTAEPAAPGHSRTQPVDAGVPVTTADGLGLTVVSARLDATQIVLDADPLSDTPASGNRFTVIRVRIENLEGPVDSERSIDSSQFRLVGSSGRVFSTLDHSCGVVPDELSLSLFGGGTGEGNVCFETPVTESDLVLFYEPSSSSNRLDRRWLKTAGPDIEEPARSVEVSAEPGPEVEPTPDPRLEQLGLFSHLLAEAVTLSPAFDDTVLSYTTSVPYEIARLTVTAVPSAGAESTFVGEDGVSDRPDADIGTLGYQVNLVPGENVIRVRASEGEASRTYTIIVARAKPAINIIAPATEVGEGDSPEFTVLRNPAAPDALEVTIEIGETGDLVDAGDEGIKKVTIMANAVSATHTVPTVPDDAAWDAHSIVAVTVRPDGSYTLGPNHSGQVAVEDDDFPEIVADLTAHPNPVNEGRRVTTVLTLTTVSEQQPHADGGSIEVYALDGTAEILGDYESCEKTHTILLEDFSLVEAFGERRYRATYTSTYNIVEDAIEEREETFTVAIRQPGDMTLPGGSSGVNVVITEHAQPAEVSPEPASRVDGGQGPQLENLCLSHGDLAEPIALSPAFEGSAFAYAARVLYEVAQPTVTVIAREGVDSIVVEEDGVTVRPDVDDDLPGHQVALNPGENVIGVRVIGAEASQIYTITLERARPVVNVSVEASSESEGEPLEFAVRRSPSAPDELEVFFDISETGDFVAAEDEGIKRVTIPAGAGTATYTVNTDPDDSTWDLNSIVFLTVQTDEAYEAGIRDSAQVEVLDDDFPETVAVLTAHPNPVAKDGIVTVSLTLTTVSDQRPQSAGGTIGFDVSVDPARGGSGFSFIIYATDFGPVDVGGHRRYRAIYSLMYSPADFTFREGEDALLIRSYAPNHPMISLTGPSRLIVSITE